jgi:long-subunit fatty acid transport protein
MIWLALITAAYGSTGSGLGLTPLGGGLAGISEPGALGLPSTPAAAKPDSAEIVVDAGATLYTLGAQLDGAAREEINGFVPMPYLGFAAPIGDFGIGVYAMIPYGGGADFSPNGAQRFHAISAASFLIEAGLPIAYKATDWLTVGASFRVGRASLAKNTAMNTAGLVNSKADLDPTLPTDSELLIGSQTLDISGYGVGYGLGASFMLPNELEIHLGYRSPMKTTMTGSVDLTPSNDLQLSASGTAEGSMQFAREVELGVVVPVGKTRLAMTAGWVDWSPLATIDVGVRNLQVKSNDDTMAVLLASTGLNESDLLAAGTDIHNDLGHTDVFHGGAALGIPLGEDWEVRPAAYYSPTTVPDEAFHVGIADFVSWDLRLSGAYAMTPWLTAGLSLDQFVIRTRTIRTSGLSLENSAASGRVLPSANGKYDMHATRMGLSFIARK